jgi:hypothetical protein
MSFASGTVPRPGIGVVRTGQRISYVASDNDRLVHNLKLRFRREISHTVRVLQGSLQVLFAEMS